MRKVDVGDGRLLTARFVDSSGNPTVVQVEDVNLTIRRPDGVETTVESSELEIVDGAVAYTLVFTMPGTWHWVFQWSDGVNLPEVGEDSAFVRVPRVSRST